MTEDITFIPQAYCGYSGNGRAYVGYEGRLTAGKEIQIRDILCQVGYVPGWKSKNVAIKRSGGMWAYKEDGASGLLPSIEIFHLSGDK